MKVLWDLSSGGPKKKLARHAGTSLLAFCGSLRGDLSVTGLYFLLIASSAKSTGLRMKAIRHRHHHSDAGRSCAEVRQLIS
jgi:hypothetical protein